MQRTVLIIIFFLAVLGADAQDSVEKQSLKFSVLGGGGILIGQSSINGQLQAIAGMRFNGWFAGAGVGVDDYFERTVPLFVDVRKTIFNKNNSPFVYAEGGYHVVWLKNEKPFEQDHRGGWFYEAGGGYAFRLKKKTALMLSLGYSLKPFSKKQSSMAWISIWPPPAGSLQQYDYRLRRLSLKAAIRF